jgi:hypothetical protein
MAISRADLLKELLPGLNDLFGMEYKNYKQRHRERIGGNEYIHNVQRETPADSAGTAGIKQQTI